MRRKTGLLDAARWGGIWGGLYLIAQALGVIVDAGLLAVNFLGVGGASHGDRSAQNLIDNYIIAEIPGRMIFLGIPLAVTLAVLWFAGPRLRSRSFRILSFGMFLWTLPVQLMFGVHFIFEIWLIISVTFAAAIRQPRGQPSVASPPSVIAR